MGHPLKLCVVIVGLELECYAQGEVAKLVAGLGHYSKVIGEIVADTQNTSNNKMRFFCIYLIPFWP